MAADLTMTGSPRLADPHAPMRFSGVAGEAIVAGDACFVQNDGLIYQCDATDHCTIANVSNFEGICLTAAAAGETVTLFGCGSKIYLTSTSQTIGTFWYVGDNEGVLYDTLVATADTYLPVVKFITHYVAEVVRAGV